MVHFHILQPLHLILLTLSCTSLAVVRCQKMFAGPRSQEMSAVLLWAGWAVVNCAPYRCSFLPSSLLGDYCRVVACYHTPLSSLGLVIESFRTCWAHTSWRCGPWFSIDLLHFKYIAAFHIYVSAVGETLPAFTVLLEFRPRFYLFPWQQSLVFCRNYTWWSALSFCCNLAAPEPFLVPSFLSLNILYGWMFPSDIAAGLPFYCLFSDSSVPISYST